MTAPQVAETTRNGERRDIVMQAFERTVLTYDQLNPRDWQVERGNIGTDHVAALGQTAPNPPSQNTPDVATSFVRQFLHYVSADPQAAETSWADFLSQREAALRRHGPCARQRLGHAAVRHPEHTARLPGQRPQLPRPDRRLRHRAGQGDGALDLDRWNRRPARLPSG